MSRPGCSHPCGSSKRSHRGHRNDSASNRRATASYSTPFATGASRSARIARGAHYCGKYHKNCRYCPACDLLITHQDEVEQQLSALFANCAPELIGNDYLVLGTLDRDIWKRGVAEPLAIQEMVEQLHDFVEVLELRRAEV